MKKIFIKEKIIIFVFIFKLQFITSNLHSAFREINFTPRSSALSGAFCAVSDDASAVIYNSAGIGQIKKYELNFSYTKLFAGLEDVNISLNYGSIVLPLGWFVGAITYNELLEDSYNERMIILTFSKEVTSFLNKIYDFDIKTFSGINLKYLRNQFVLDQRTINDPVFTSGSSKDNYTLDLGFLFVKDNLSAGISGKNLTQPDTGLTNKENLPVELRLGLGYKFLNSRLSVDVSYREQQWGKMEDKINVHLGIENELFKDVLNIVAGVNMTEFGCGFLFKIPARTKFESYVNFSFNYPFYLINFSGNYRVGLVLKI